MYLKRRRRGFTLVEILVALVLIGLLAGALVPAVVNQISKGETGRLVEDLRAMETASKAFRVDVQRWPRGIRQLMVAPTTSDTALVGGAYPASLVSRWRGPYLERGTIPGDSILTAFGGVILPIFTPANFFLTVQVKGISQENARSVSLILDGDTEVASSGRVRWVTGDTLRFHITPLY